MNETNFYLSLQHLQYRLLEKGMILIRNEETHDGVWFVNCFVYKDYQRYLDKELTGNNQENKVYIYRNYVSDLKEAIDNCIKLLDYYDSNNK